MYLYFAVYFATILLINLAFRKSIGGYFYSVLVCTPFAPIITYVIDSLLIGPEHPMDIIAMFIMMFWTLWVSLVVGFFIHVLPRRWKKIRRNAAG